MRNTMPTAVIVGYLATAYESQHYHCCHSTIRLFGLEAPSQHTQNQAVLHLPLLVEKSLMPY